MDSRPDQIRLKHLGGLDSEQGGAVQRLLGHAPLRPLDRIGHRDGRGRRSGGRSTIQHLLQHLQRQQRPGPVVDGDELRVLPHLRQACLDGVDPLPAAHDHLGDLLQGKLPAQAADLHQQVLPGDHHHLGDVRTRLKDPQGMYQDREIPQRGQDLIDPLHAGGRPRSHHHRRPDMCPLLSVPAQPGQKPRHNFPSCSKEGPVRQRRSKHGFRTRRPPGPEDIGCQAPLSLSSYGITPGRG